MCSSDLVNVSAERNAAHALAAKCCCTEVEELRVTTEAARSLGKDLGLEFLGGDLDSESGKHFIGVFAWPGIGQLFVQSVQSADIPVMASYLVMVGLIFVLINLVVDLLYFAVDPRLRTDAAAPAH